jgi:hypothetical protein
MVGSPWGTLCRTVNFGNFLYPSASFNVFERQQLRVRPVEMIGNVGYLLIELREGVA